MQIQLVGSVNGTARFRSFEIGGPAAVSASFGGMVSVSVPSGPVVSVQPSAFASGSISATDGVRGFVASDSQTTAVATIAMPPPASVVGAFVGIGSVGLPDSVAIRSSASGPLNLNASLASSGSASVTLNYTSGESQTGSVWSSGGSGFWSGGIVPIFFGAAITARQVRTVADQTTGWHSDLGFTKFDPNLGALLGVNLSLTSDPTAQDRIENLDAAAA